MPLLLLCCLFVCPHKGPCPVPQPPALPLGMILQRIYRHPGYDFKNDARNYAYDIALLQLDRRVKSLPFAKLALPDDAVGALLFAIPCLLAACFAKQALPDDAVGRSHLCCLPPLASLAPCSAGMPRAHWRPAQQPATAATPPAC